MLRGLVAVDPLTPDGWEWAALVVAVLGLLVTCATIPGAL